VHERCPFLSVNGIRAAARYVMCHCTCHDGEDRARDILIVGMGHWDDQHPEASTTADMSRYVDAVNAQIAAGRATDAHQDEEGVRDDE
jgi:hypothetical protein